MSARMSPQRRAAFFRALFETGNQSLAAERAKVSRSWVCLHRKSDPEFDAAVRAAISEARASLSQRSGSSPEHSGRKPPGGWGHLDGEELVVKGTGGSGGTGGRRVQIARARLQQWTPRVEQRFLAALMATCNVKAACAEAGMSAAGAYAHRKRWRRFAELWREAIAEGFARLEIALLENGLNLFGETELPPETPLRGMDVTQAIHLIHMHKYGVFGLGGAPGRRRLPVGINHPVIRDGIKRKIAAIIAARDIPPAAREADRQIWARRQGGGGGRGVDADHRGKRKVDPGSPACAGAGKSGMMFE